ncbi:MAG: hypothetical protein QOJ72_305 [Nocardioidaceae bacterium]|jgi:hypothetical protein|nr:hypothetical protein [Nocardioidaceae bacterium]
MPKKSRKTKSQVAAAPPAKTSAGGKGAWKLMDRGSTVAAGILAHRVAGAVWRAATGRKPPINGRHPDVRTGEAVAWAVVGGGLAELVKVAVRRGTSTYWVKSTGHLPPGMKPLASEGSANKKEPVPTEPAPQSTSTRKVSRRSRGR